MPKIFELLGYPITDQSAEVKESRARAFCPFMGSICDGGGNRYMSEINLAVHPELSSYFPGLPSVASGICSIQVKDGEPPWIICPRRLLYMGRKAPLEVLKGRVQKQLLDKCGFSKGRKLGVWSEVKVKYTGGDREDVGGLFDYTFDYVIVEIGRERLETVASKFGITLKEAGRMLEKSEYTLAQIGGTTFVEDFPIGCPVIVEVMTSSTSGGNKKRRSCIPQAFEDCVLGKEHTAPGINYRQVWARMASQLIVKSQAAMAWEGKTIWVLQDLLAEYISASTALDLHQFMSENTDEVNILAYSYGDSYKTRHESKTIELRDSTLYAGPIRPLAEGEARPSFQDIVLASVCPPKEVLLMALCKKPMSNRFRY